MDDWSTIISLAIQIPFVILMAYILDRQARIGIEIFKHLMAEFKTMNERQAERHEKVTESLLGLIDELAARSQPEKVSSKQLKLIQEYLDSQDQNVR